MKTLQRILKADEVALEGPVRLGLETAAATGSSQPPAPSAEPSVRMVQNHAEYVLLEVTCTCGRTTVVRCDYTPAVAAPAPQDLAQP
jgi:hypothetical protein